MQEVGDLETCHRLAEAIKPGLYKVAICSHFAGRQQEAILAKIDARAAFAVVEGFSSPRLLARPFASP